MQKNKCNFEKTLDLDYMIMKSEDFTSEIGVKYELVPSHSSYSWGLEDYDTVTYFEANRFNIFITSHCICIGAVLLRNNFLTKLVFICCITCYKCK